MMNDGNDEHGRHAVNCREKLRFNLLHSYCQTGLRSLHYEKNHLRCALKIVPVTVITIKWGDNLYGPHYVNRLYAGVRRN